MASSDVSVVSGYIGSNITLHSKADPSWKLKRIVWSILSNNTWIATFIKNETNTDHFFRYQKRLILNITSGKKKKKNQVIVKRLLFYFLNVFTLNLVV